MHPLRRLSMSEFNLPQAAEARPPDVNVAARGEDDGDVTILFAVVNANGTLARGHKAVSATRLGTGAYEVVFRKDVRSCAYLATIGLSGSAGSSLPGEITVVGRSGNDRGVFVTTHSSGGASADLGFHLAVHCAGDDD
jgi:hypothetical protein